MQIRRMFVPTMTTMLAVAVVLALPVTAASVGHKGPQGYYLALGDSIAYGYQPNKGAQPARSTRGMSTYLPHACARCLRRSRSSTMAALVKPP